MRHLLLLLLLAPPAAAKPPEKEYRNDGRDGLCAGRARDMTLRVPRLETAKDRGESKSRLESLNAQARLRLLEARLATAAVLEARGSIIAATQQCSSPPDHYERFASTAEAAVSVEALQHLRVYERSGWALIWEDAATSALEAELKDVVLTTSAFAGACRGEAADVELFAPEDPRFAEIAKTAATVQSAIRAQESALKTLLKLAGGHGCRDMLETFGRLVADERARYFAYRDRAISKIVQEDLKWKRVE